jgi:replicative DNA helicase
MAAMDNFNDIIDPNEFDEMDNFFRTNPEGFSGEGLRPVSFVLAESILMVQAWRRNEVGGGFRANISALDQYIQFAPKELTIIAGRPGTGKTALTIQLITDAVREDNSKERVAIFSAEMSGSMLLMRLACAIAEVDIPTLRRGMATPEQYDGVVSALRDLSEMPIWISDKSAPDYLYMKAELEDFQKDYTLAAVVFDFMELLRTRGKTNEERASMAVTALKDIAKEFNVPVIGISQLNREVEDRADKLPRMSDLRSSGMIEQLADNIILMMRPKYYQDKGMEVDTKNLDKTLGPTNIEDPCYFVIAKNRNGATGMAYCAFDAKKMMFYDIQRTPLTDAEEMIGDDFDEQETEEA